MTTPTAGSLRFGRFVLEPHERRLLVSGQPAAIGARALDLLVALAERAGQLVGKHALMELVWPDVVVEDNNLAAQISALRKVLGGEVIATIPGRGYRFTARLDSDEATAPPAAQSGPASAPPEEVAATSSADAVKAAASAGMRTNLPVELQALLGRADDLVALGNLIDQHPLVSIVGAGGIGKTLLAQHLLDARRSAYPHGVCWVELAPITDSAALPGAIAAALGVDSGKGEPLAALLSALAPLTVLLALDNAEHLVDDVARLCQALREGAPGLRLVVTSQVPLKLAAERVYRIGPLAVPDGPLSATRALEFGAVALFVDRAQAADARFALTDANAAVVIEVCRALDGLALAIELAAARVPLLGVQRLAASMRDRLSLLTSNRSRDAPSRQQTLRAALEWSHSFLDDREQKVFRRLGVVAGSASLELIQRVVADPKGEGELDEWAALDALGVLVDRSLVSVFSTVTGTGTESAVPRYRLLDSPRALALEQLATGEHETLRRRHAQAVAAQFDAAWDKHFDGTIRHDDWLREMSFDIDNAREALDWAAVASDAAAFLAIGATLISALPHSMHLEAKSLAERCEAMIDPAVPTRLQQRAWYAIAMLSSNAQRRHTYVAAQRAVELARELCTGDRDPLPLYLALGRFAGAAANLGESELATTALAERSALEDSAWPPQRLYLGASDAAHIAHLQGNSELALRLRRRGAALDRARGAQLSWNLVYLVDAELAAGNAAVAAKIGTELIAALQTTRNEYSLNTTRVNLVAALLSLDERESARRVAREGWPMAVSFELQAAWADYLSLLLALEHRYHDAAKLLGYADTRYGSLDDTRQPNEASAFERARRIALAAIGEVEFDRCRIEGSALLDTDIFGLVFGSAEPAASPSPVRPLL